MMGIVAEIAPLTMANGTDSGLQKWFAWAVPRAVVLGGYWELGSTSNRYNRCNVCILHNGVASGGVYGTVLRLLCLL